MIIRRRVGLYLFFLPFFWPNGSDQDRWAELKALWQNQTDLRKTDDFFFKSITFLRLNRCSCHVTWGTRPSFFPMVRKNCSRGIYSGGGGNAVRGGGDKRAPQSLGNVINYTHALRARPALISRPPLEIASHFPAVAK